MSRGRFTALLVAALIVLAAALYLGSARNAGEPSAQGTAFLPQLASSLGTVSQIDLQKGAPAPAVPAPAPGAPAPATPPTPGQPAGGNGPAPASGAVST